MHIGKNIRRGRLTVLNINVGEEQYGCTVVIGSLAKRKGQKFCCVFKKISQILYFTEPCVQHSWILISCQ